MTVLWFLQRPEHSLGKPAVFVSLASCYVVVDEVVFCFFSVRPSDFCLLSDFVSLSLLPPWHWEPSVWAAVSLCCPACAVVYTLKQTEAPDRYRFPVMFSATTKISVDTHTQAGVCNWRYLTVVFACLATSPLRAFTHGRQIAAIGEEFVFR